MKRVELDQLLKSAKAPMRSEKYWEEFPDRIVTRLNRTLVSENTRKEHSPRFRWGLAAGLASLAVCLSIFVFRSNTAAPSRTVLLQDEKMISETLSLFPNRLRAIVQDARGMNLILSEKEDVPSSAPLFIKVCDGQNCLSFVTFSGQEIRAAGNTLIVLSDQRGGVMLVGEHFLWSSADPKRIGSLKIEAKQLGEIRQG